MLAKNSMKNHLKSHPTYKKPRPPPLDPATSSSAPSDQSQRATSPERPNDLVIDPFCSNYRDWRFDGAKPLPAPGQRIAPVGDTVA